MSWEIEFTDQAREWIDSLDDEDYDAMAGVLDLLEQDGPSLGRPAVDRIHGSRHHKLEGVAVERPASEGIVLLRPAPNRK